MNKQKVVLITGSSSGFGYLAAQTLAHTGSTRIARAKTVKDDRTPLTPST